jgi:hypothetical protein
MTSTLLSALFAFTVATTTPTTTATPTPAAPPAPSAAAPMAMEAALVAGFLAQGAATDARADVLTSVDLRNALDLEAQKQMAACGQESSCLAELAQALDAHVVLSSVLSRVEDEWVLSVSAYDARKASSAGRRMLRAPSSKALLTLAEAGGADLLRAILTSHTGEGRVRVLVMDVAVNMTPLLPPAPPMATAPTTATAPGASMTTEGPATTTAPTSAAARGVTAAATPASPFSTLGLGGGVTAGVGVLTTAVAIAADAIAVTQPRSVKDASNAKTARAAAEVAYPLGVGLVLVGGAAIVVDGVME